jgi:hypothetical protein
LGIPTGEVSPYLGRVWRNRWQGTANSGGRVANAATPMRRRAKVSACSTTQTKCLMIAEPDAPEASPEAVSQRYCRSTRRTILSVIQTRSRFVGRLHQSASPRATRSSRRQCDGLLGKCSSEGVREWKDRRPVGPFGICPTRALWHFSAIPDASAYELLFSFSTPEQKDQFLDS